MKYYIVLTSSVIILLTLLQGVSAAPSDILKIGKAGRVDVPSRPPVYSRADIPSRPRDGAVEPTRNTVPEQVPKHLSRAPHGGRMFDFKQVKSKYKKHAHEFGINEKESADSIKKFRAAMQAHCESMNTRVITGTYKKAPAVHFVDPNSRMNVVMDRSGNFWTTYKLSSNQLNTLLTTGRLSN